MDNPLNEQHLQCLNTVLQSCPGTAELIAKCKECGFDMSKAQEQNEEQRQFAATVKAQFFQGHV